MIELPGYALKRLREGRDFVLYRGRRVGDDMPVFAVTPSPSALLPSSVERLQHEYALRSDLRRTYAAMPLDLIHRLDRWVLILEDTGLDPLEGLPDGPLDLRRFLRTAIGACGALRQFHLQGLIHNDVKPENLLVDDAGNVKLTGFGVASRLSRERQMAGPARTIAGTLAYMAPEKSGRMNRSVDTRSDLYSLGVTFYEMLVGALPFSASDPMEWIHCHLARKPRAPSDRVRGIPPALDAIILKLLAKAAEDRYQTADGVEADLGFCLREWQQSSRIEPFVLGKRDVPYRLTIPERLYGRTFEANLLAVAFDRVMNQGRAEIFLLSGSAGVGKSSIVNELHKSLVRPRGLFTTCKFDQHRRDIPYESLSHAIRHLIHHILGESDAELDRWRRALQAALGANGQLMINLIPDLALIVGEQPLLPPAAAHEVQNLFHLMFTRLLGVFARPEHPLALFLDDVQWVDSATSGLVERLIAGPQALHLLLICAYRDDVLTSPHRLAPILESIRTAALPVQEVAVEPLGADDVLLLIADAVHAPKEEVAPLAELVFEKAGGNPFFTSQFLTTIANEALLVFDHESRDWRWDIARIRESGITDNVATLMAGKLTRLSDPALDAIKHLACLGNQSQIDTLGVALGLDVAATRAILDEPLRAGLVLCKSDNCRFVHDRVLEAAYELIPGPARAGLHLDIGRRLALHTAADTLPEHVFEIVGQLNRGAALILLPEEREQLARLNQVAGARAKAGTAHQEAAFYFRTGLALLQEEHVHLSPRLRFDLEQGLAECEFLTGEVAAAADRLSRLMRETDKLADKASTTGLRIPVHTTLGQLDLAVQAGLEYLRHAGIDWQAHPTDEDVENELQALHDRLGDQPIHALVDLPLMSDAACQVTMEVLQQMVAPAVFTDQNLLGVVLLRMANLSLQHGNCDASCYAYVCLNMVVGVRFGDYTSGYAFGKLSFDLVEKRGLNRFKDRVYVCFGAAVVPWVTHIEAGRTWIQRALDISRQTGNLTYEIYSSEEMITLRLIAADPLADVLVQANEFLVNAQRAGFEFGSAMITGQICLMRYLIGMTPEFAAFTNCPDEASFERHLDASPHLSLPSCWYWIRKLQARFHAGDHRSAIAAAEKVKAGLWMTGAFFEAAEYEFYGALARAAAIDEASPAEQAAHRQALDSHRRKIAEWTKSCPENFETRDALIAAEVARLEGRVLEAEHLYETAISSAHRHGFLQNEALSNELAARFYGGRGFKTISDAYLDRACSRYADWGANGKVRQLETTHPQLRKDPTLAGRAGETTADQLALATIVKMSHAVSCEIELVKLIDTVMLLALEHAGAERGVLVLIDGEDFRTWAEARTVADQVELRTNPTGVAPTNLPDSIMRYVQRTGKSVLLDDASRSHQFSGDCYFVGNPCRSILCLPMIKQSRLIGLLYLENQQASHVFTASRFEVLRLLASQAAISLESARVYADLRQTEENLVHAQQKERDRIARELHDTLLQSTHALVLQIQAAANHLPAGDPNRCLMEKALDRADKVITEARDRVLNLRVPSETLVPLPEALAAAGEDLVRDGSVECRTSVQGRARELTLQVNDQAYRIGREALLNAVRHAGGTLIEVDIIYADEELRVRVRDDGVGLDAALLQAGPIRDHWGLKGMQERAEQIGARLDVWSRQGAGTEMELTVPAAVAYRDVIPPTRWRSFLSPAAQHAEVIPVGQRR